MKRIISVDISDMKIAKAPDVLVTYALGSCVGICLYDTINKIGALAHIMLPSSQRGSDNNLNINRFADTCIPSMIEELQKHNCYKINLVANIIGGANMFNYNSNRTLNNFNNIGQSNVVAVKNELIKLGIPIISEETGEDYARTVFFDTDTGKVSIKNSNREINAIFF